MKRLTFWAVAACLLALLVVVIVWPTGTWHRVHDDFWPFDRSFVGPNLVASIVQWLIVALVAVIVYPPLREWAGREWDHLHAKADLNARMLAHLIKHSKAIPNEDHNGVPFHEQLLPEGRAKRKDRTA